MTTIWGLLRFRRTGTYTIEVNGGSGNVTATVYSITNNLGTMSVGGPPVNFSDSIPGESPTYSFAGVAGESLTLTLSNSTYYCCSNTLSILNPDGSTLVSGLFYTSYYNEGGITIGPVTLPSTGSRSRHI
jgi:hypothetical protein